MNLKINFLKFIFLILLLNINSSNQSQNSYKEMINKRKLQNSGFAPIRILIDISLIELYSQVISLNELYYATRNCSQILSKLISVKSITKDNPIKYDFSHQNLNISRDIINKTLIEGNYNYDLIIIATLRSGKTYMETLTRDDNTKRTTLGYISINFEEIYNIKQLKVINLQYLFIHYIIHFLGFSYENFDYFNQNGNKIKVYETELDQRMNLNTYYIITPKVLEIAKKYYNCPTLTRFPLENQEGNSIAHWDARLLLGDIMNSYNNESRSDQVISEFTLALLEDSGWYQVNYFTGGLMRFGKNKGCNFINNNCTTEFKNEFCEYYIIPNYIDYRSGSCSSGRQSRTYCMPNNYDYNYLSIPEYYRKYEIKGAIYADYCLINEPHENEERDNPIVGSCRYPLENDNYGSRIDFKTNVRSDVSSELFETISNQSFCVLISLIPNITNNLNNPNDLLDIIHPMCYQMFCSDTTLTIKIKEQYIACPRQGGKVEIKGEFKGYLYCPDYYLICSGTVFCNDLFDCIEKKSITKEESYTYTDYQSNTNQIQSELKNEQVLIGYEESNNGKCKLNCAQCYSNGICFQCRENYFFVGDYLGQNINDIKCLEIDVNSGYFLYENIYYPCLKNCEICTNDTLCQKCKNDFYFIGNNRTYCDNTKDLTKYFSEDGGISYYQCNTSFPYCDTCQSRNNCTKCVSNYYFVRNNWAVCNTLPDKSNYFTEDGGISYLLCSDYIPGCRSCNSSNFCTKCNQNFYMIGDDRTQCVNNIITNFNEYYIEDAEGPVYYPCDSHFSNCLTCTSKSDCTQCKSGFIFLRGQREECFTQEEDKTYIDSDGYYYPCNDAYPFCNKCKRKGTCYNCFHDYYFTYDENNNLLCDDIDESKYYNENDIYYLCSKAITNCEQCQNGNVCDKCQNHFYFLKNDHTNCRSDLDLRKYYSLDNNISFYPCNEAMTQCDFCSNDTECEKCNDNFYLYKENKKNCIVLDNIERYYKNGTSYYPCNESIENCEKCNDGENCYECNNNLKIILGEQNHCYNENILSTNNSLIKKNDTFYMKCSDNISHCETCELDNNENEIICIKCETNYIFLNEDKKHCLYSLNLTPPDEYIRINNTDYFTCNYKGVEHCQKCKNLISCDLCTNDFAFVNMNYSSCHNKSLMQKGFYHDYSEVMYFPCLKNCEVCMNGIECIKCMDNYTSFKENTFCGICELNIDYLYNNTLTENLVDKLTQDYINQNEDVFSMVDIIYNIDENNNTNYNIIIFRSSECTKLIFEQNDYIEINLDELSQKINSESLNNLIFTLVNYNYKSILNIYSISPEGNTKINLSEICPECVEDNYLKIKNNFRLELNNKLTPILLEEIVESDYNIFSEDESVFNDICYNFNIKKIDIPLNERRKLFYLGNESMEILCSNINCEIKNIFVSNATSFCDCGINTDFNYLFTSNDININREEEYNKFIDGKKTVNSFLLFKCAKKAFNAKNLKNNIGLYISCGLFVIQLVLLIVYITYKKSRNKKSKKSLKSNPPKLGEIANFSISDDLEDDQEEKEIGDFEKKNQKKEKKFFEEKKNEDNILNDDEDDDEGDDENNVQDKDIDSEREREIENEIVDLGGKITEENLRIQQNNFKRSRNWNKSGKNLLNKEINKPRNKSKLNFLEEESFEGDEQINEGEQTIPKKRSNKLYRNKKLYSLGSKESFNLSEVNEIKDDIYQKTENIKFTDAIKQKEISFWEYYFKLLQLKQPLINLFSPIKCLKLEDNNIPTLVKIMRIIFILSLNIFFNIFHLEQKYFRKKFDHFNNKYNLINEKIEGNISTNEIFTYALIHAILSGFISFIVCLIIQSILNIFIFNSRKKLNVIASRKSMNKGKDYEKVHEIYLILKRERKWYIIFFSIGMVVMVIIFYLLINFNEVFRGGILDLVAGVFWTFIFLQIIPFIYCLIFALIRYKGIKNKNKKMYLLSQIIFF